MTESAPLWRSRCAFSSSRAAARSSLRLELARGQRDENGSIVAIRGDDHRARLLDSHRPLDKKLKRRAHQKQRYCHRRCISTPPPDAGSLRPGPWRPVLRRNGEHRQLENETLLKATDVARMGSSSAPDA